MLAKLIAFCALATIATTSPALAGGDYYARKLLSSSFGSCPSGFTQVERVGYYADVYGLLDRLIEACMADEKVATWVILAGTQCFDEDDEQAAVRCFDVKERQGVPMLFEEQGLDDSSRPPFRLDYSLIKYAAGKDCRVVDVPHSRVGDPTIAWDCKAVAFIDGTRDAKGLPIANPGQIRVRAFHSRSNVPLAIQYTDEDKLALPTGLVGHAEDQYMVDLSSYAK